LLRSALSKIYLALGPVALFTCGVTKCPFCCKLAVETWLAPVVFIYLHEATQYVMLGSEVELKLEGGYVVLEPRGRPRRPRLALIAGIAAPVGVATWHLAPMFSTLFLLLLFLLCLDMLEIRGLVVGYDKPLIRPLDLRLGGGESAVFFGPNGVGKTTLAKTVASLLRPLGGSVLLDGVPTHKARGRIFYLSEAIDMPERVKAVDYVEALASFYGAADSARDLLDVVGVPGRLPLGKMSQGMRRLVQLAAAMAVLPKVGLAVLDDPYVSVAPDKAAEVHRELLRRAKNTVLILTARIPLETSLQIDFLKLKP
jgi:ABC-2 type transport system ATP-binding protein